MLCCQGSVVMHAAEAGGVQERDWLQHCGRWSPAKRRQQQPQEQHKQHKLWQDVALCEKHKQKSNVVMDFEECGSVRASGVVVALSRWLLGRLAFAACRALCVACERGSARISAAGARSSHCENRLFCVVTVNGNNRTTVGSANNNRVNTGILVEQ
jgi:hypothetical protein